MSLGTKSFSIFKRDAFLYITQIITSVIIARKLGPEMMGIFALLTMITSYAESFGRMKFDIAAVYFLGKNKYKIGDVVFTLNMLALITSAVIITLIIWQFDWLYNLLFSKSTFDARFLIYFILLQIPLQFLYMNYSYILVHKEDIKTYNWMIIIKSLISSVLGIFLLLVFNLGLWAIAGAGVLSFLVSLIYGALNLGSYQTPSNIINKPLIKDLFQYGFKLYLSGLVGHFQAYITNLIVALYLVPAQIAYFSMARGLGQLMDKVPAALSTILFPRITKAVTHEEAAQLSARATRLSTLLLIFVGLIAYLLIKPAVYIMYGAKYLPLVTPFMILIPGIVLAGATTPFMQYFMGINRADLGITLPIFPLIIQLSLSLILIPAYGTSGAALSFVAGLLLYSFISTWMFIKLSGCSIKKDLMIQRKDVYFILDFFAEEVRKGKNILSNIIKHT